MDIFRFLILLKVRDERSQFLAEVDVRIWWKILGEKNKPLEINFFLIIISKKIRT